MPVERICSSPKFWPSFIQCRSLSIRFSESTRRRRKRACTAIRKENSAALQRSLVDPTRLAAGTRAVEADFWPVIRRDSRPLLRRRQGDRTTLPAKTCHSQRHRETVGLITSRSHIHSWHIRLSSLITQRQRIWITFSHTHGDHKSPYA